MAQYSSTDKTATGASVNAVLNSETGTITYTVTTPSGLSTAVTAPVSQDPQQGVAIINAIRQQLAVQNGGSQLGLEITGFGNSLNITRGEVNRQAETAQTAAAATNTTVPANNTPTVPSNNATDPAVPPAAPQASSITPSATAPASVPPEDDGFPPPPEFDNRPIDFEAPPLDPETEALLVQQQAINRAQLQQEEAIAYAPAPVPPSQAGPIGAAYDDNGFLRPGYTLDEDRNPVFVGGGFVEPATAASAAGSRTAAAANRAKNQSTLQTRVNQPAAADWRVRLRLAPNADYLYKVSENNGGAGILAPLAVTDGVVFPYTPSIETSYQAKYDNYDLTHSNYRGYFYKSSMIENVSIKGTFTAQDTREAQYLLAVIHFFKSVTKMFYGQDQQAGTPPPLVYLSGFGKYQFNESPCVVTNFNYSLPNDVDYIRADGFNNIGLNMGNRRPQSSGPAMGGSLGTVVAILDRLSNAGLKNGSLTNRPSPGQVNQNVANQTSINSTYVPTKMEISITLLPMQTRNQVSKQFSLKSFANGSLLAGGGFW
jgi:hypothetical protein